MPTLYVPILGRLGNILFQVAHALKWCEQNHHTLCMWPWMGEQVFQIPQCARPNQSKPDVIWGEKNMCQHQKDLNYTRADVKKWFAWKPEVLEKLRKIDTQSHPFVLNVRQASDCLETDLPMLSDECYRQAAQKFGYDANRCHWEKDTNPTRLDDFPGDPDGCGRGTSWCCIPSFYRLQQAPVLFRAASTFSWWAATLGAGRVYSPIIRDIQGGTPNQFCDNFVEGNWPAMTNHPDNSDLHLQP